MIESLRQWLVSLTAAAIFLGAAESLVSQGSVRRVLRLAGGLVLMILLLRPLSGIVGQLPELSLDGIRQETKQREEELQKQQDEAVEGLIESELGTYIWDKEQSLGLDYPVSVSTRPGAGGGSVPDRVSIDGPFHQELSDWLTTELGLGPECQIWQEE